MRSEPGIDVVTRLYDLTDLPHLDHMAFSVLSQSDVPELRLHVMLQRFASTEVQQVRTLLSRLRGLNPGATIACHNWDYPAPFDLRVPLLNFGLEVAQCRYILFADVQDRLTPGACAALHTRLLDTEAALATGGVARQPVQWWGDVILPEAAPGDPTPQDVVVMLDRARVAEQDCVFQTADAGTEGASLVKRLALDYPVDTAHRHQTLVVRADPR